MLFTEIQKKSANTLRDLTFIAVIALEAFGEASSAGGLPQTFTYQGRIFNSIGTQPMAEMADFVAGIYDPAGLCLLYEEEHHQVDLSLTDGFFAIHVGSNPGSAKRTSNDPGLSMVQIFTNSAGLIRPTTSSCPGGYVPAAGDSRILRAFVIPHSTGIPVALDPDHIIVSQPNSWVAQTLQGLYPSDFIQIKGGVPEQGNVSLATLLLLTSSGDASSLHHHDSSYVKLGATSETFLGSTAYTSNRFGIGTSSPTADLSFGGDTDRTISVDQNSNSNSAGMSLNLNAGAASSGSTNQSGGSLSLSAGTSTGTGTSSIFFMTSTSGLAGTQDNKPLAKMVLTGGGALGVGALSPNAQLQVNPSSPTTKGVLIQGGPGQIANLLELQDGAANVLAYFDASGALVLPNAPLLQNQACTKGYVDNALALNSAVSSFNARTGAVTLTTADVTTALGFNPVNNAGDTLTGTVTINPSADLTGIIIKGSPTQSASLSEWQNSEGAVLAKIDSAGGFTTASLKVFDFGAGVIQSDASGKLSSGSLNTSSVSEGSNLYYTDSRVRAALSGVSPVFVSPITGTISLTGLSGLPVSDQLLGGNSTSNALEYKTLSGTPNRVSVSFGANSITLSTPQDLNSSASPTFSGLTLLGAGSAGFVKIDATQALFSSALSSTEVSAALGFNPTNPAANGALDTPALGLTGTWFTGGTGASTKPHFLVETAGTNSSNWHTSGTGIGVNAAAGFTGNLMDLQSNGISQMVVASDGKVGIGMTSPGAPLDVKGTLRLTNGSSLNYVGLVAPNVADSTTYILPEVDGTVDQLLATNGAGKLSWKTVAGGSGAPGGLNKQIQYNNSGAFAGSTDFTWDNTAKLMTVVGDINYTGVLTDTSDQRLKTNIKPLTEANVVDRLQKVNTYSFRMKDPVTARIEFGVMAQELEEIFPELVHTATDKLGTKSVNYMGFIAPLLEAYRQLQREVAAQKQELAFEKQARQQQNLGGMFWLLIGFLFAWTLVNTYIINKNIKTMKTTKHRDLK